jgi:cytochrome c5
VTTQTVFKAAAMLALAATMSGALALSDREQAIADRIGPAGAVCVQGDASCDPAAAPAEPAAAAAVDDPAGEVSALPATAEAATEAAVDVSSDLVASAARSGETVYNGACVACHAAGVAGAPKLADPAGWAGRLEKGEDTLVAHVINGFNAMPAMGACMDCSEEEIRLAVEYMLDTL